MYFLWRWKNKSSIFRSYITYLDVLQSSQNYMLVQTRCKSWYIACYCFKYLLALLKSYWVITVSFCLRPFFKKNQSVIELLKSYAYVMATFLTVESDLDFDLHLNRIRKVLIFWEGHKILRNLHLTFYCVYCGQK